MDEGPLGQKAIADRLGQQPTSAKELLERLDADGFIDIDASGTRPSYSASSLGRRIVGALVSAVEDRTGVDLESHVLVCARRPVGRAPDELRTHMSTTARALLSGHGSFLYVAILEDDPSLVATLQARVEALGCEAASFRVSRCVHPVR